MASRYFIVVGDPTTAGGHALAGYSGGRVQCLDGVSRNVVRVGDPVLCGECGPTTVTKGHPFALLPGGLLAYDGSDLACGHKMVSKLQRLFSWDEPSGRDGPSHVVSEGKSNLIAHQAGSAKQDFDEHFRFVDTALGRPLAGIGCVLFPESDSPIADALNAAGCSPRHCKDFAERVEAAIEAPSPLLD